VAIPALAPAYARPAAPPVPVPVGPPTPCPVCRSTTGLNEAACSTCGLVFVSRIPQTLQNLSRYKIVRPLGDGGMSSVYLARVGQTDTLCVIKTLVSVDGNNDDAWRAQAARCLEQEANLLSQIEHPRIARLLDRIATPLEALVLEYIPGPTLADRIAQQRPTQKEAINWAIQTAEVLVELAALPEPLLHLDIKPANLILPPNRPGPVLVDFGGAMTARQLEQSTTTEGLFGTPGYAAPEQYRGLASPQSDVYGLAATLYFALTNDDPADHPLNFPLLPTLPQELADLLRQALAHEPADRPSAAAFVAALRTY
jgi:eukaryotic-like serine/threonine-protein kinase